MGGGCERKEKEDRLSRGYILFGIFLVFSSVCMERRVHGIRYFHHHKIYLKILSVLFLKYPSMFHRSSMKPTSPTMMSAAQQQKVQPLLSPQHHDEFLAKPIAAAANKDNEVKKKPFNILILGCGDSGKSSKFFTQRGKRPEIENPKRTNKMFVNTFE